MIYLRAQPRGLASKDAVVKTETAALLQAIVGLAVNLTAMLKQNVGSMPQLRRKTAR